MTGRRNRRGPGRRPLALLAAVATLWSLCFALHLDALGKGRLAWIPVAVEGASGPDEHPRVASFWSEPDRAASTVAPGDHLLRAGDRDLRGSRGLATAARLYAAAREGTVDVRVARAGDTREGVVALRSVLQPWRLSGIAALFFLVGALVCWRAGRQPAARLLFLALAAYSLHLAYFWGGGERRNALAFVVFGAGLGLALPLAIRGALSFPVDVARRGWLSRAWPWLFATAGLGATSWAFGAPFSAGAGFALTVGGSVAALATVAAILALQWRRTGPLGRRQLQWVVLGALAAFAPPILVGLGALARPAWWWLYELSVTSVVLLPIAILVALVRDHLFDVDRLLTAAAGYTLVCVLLLGCTIVLVPTAASALGNVIDPQVSEPALALASAFVLLGARSRLEPWVERRLFPERIRFEAGARTLRSDLARCEKPAELFVALAERLDALLAPDSLIVFGRAEEVFAPLYERGPAVVPAVALEGPLAVELELAGRVLDVSSLATRGAHGPLLDLECGALEAMGTVLLVPVLGERLEAFVCLGAKRSGRGYAPSELSLLQSIADKVADELRRFDLEHVHRDQRALCERLRRYVPGALAERLAKGREAPVGEREVTVLFVDIRGYVGLAERRDPQVVFGFVGRYARAVSEILEQHGGTVIDVQGDGLMAVFGAPDRQEHKERRALAAARELLGAVRGLRFDARDPADPDADAVDIGIGIATGRAYVGNVTTADRAIWCVVGDTVNLAARCQALTREVDAALVVDARTVAAAGELGELSPLPAMQIRGRRARVDLYRLAAGTAPAASEAS